MQMQCYEPLPLTVTVGNEPEVVFEARFSTAPASAVLARMAAESEERIPEPFIMKIVEMVEMVVVVVKRGERLRSTNWWGCR